MVRSSVRVGGLTALKSSCAMLRLWRYLTPLITPKGYAAIRDGVNQCSALVEHLSLPNVTNPHRRDSPNIRWCSPRGIQGVMVVGAPSRENKPLTLRIHSRDASLYTVASLQKRCVSTSQPVSKCRASCPPPVLTFIKSVTLSSKPSRP